MQDVKSPNNITITVETPSINKDAFYTMGFIYEDDGLETPDHLYVTDINQLLSNNFMYASKAYSVAKSVFNINKKGHIVLLKKRKDESYQDCYDRNNTSDFYFTVIESKDIATILEFQNHIKDDFKLLFFSTDQRVTELVADKKIAYYYQKDYGKYLLYDSGDKIHTANTAFSPDSTARWLSDDLTPFEFDESDDILLDYMEESKNGGLIVLTKGRFDYSTGVDSYWSNDDESNFTADNDYKWLLEYQDINVDEANEVNSDYPEVCWIARCSQTFPTFVQWLYKTLDGADVNKVSKIPQLSNSQVYINGVNAVVGTGATCRGYYIEHEVGLDWLKYAIQINMWKYFYNNENKLNATQAGLTVLENLLKQVLDVAKTTRLFTTYQITEIKVDRSINTASMRFKAELAYSILGVDIDGVVYH